MIAAHPGSQRTVTVVVSLLATHAAAALRFLPDTDLVFRSNTRDYHLYEMRGFVEPPFAYADVDGTSLMEVWTFENLATARGWIAGDIAARIAGTRQ